MFTIDCRAALRRSGLGIGILRNEFAVLAESPLKVIGIEPGSNARFTLPMLLVP